MIKLVKYVQYFLNETPSNCFNCVFSISSTFGPDVGTVWDGNLKAGDSDRNLWSPSVFLTVSQDFSQLDFLTSHNGLIKSYLYKLFSILILCWVFKCINGVKQGGKTLWQMREQISSTNYSWNGGCGGNVSDVLARATQDSFAHLVKSNPLWK